MRYTDDKCISGCGLTGFIHVNGQRESGATIIESVAVMRERGNGLGGGFAGYGIYPDLADKFAFHLMYDDEKARQETEQFLSQRFEVALAERIPTRPNKFVESPPLLWRYFAAPSAEKLEHTTLSEQDYVVESVMAINSTIEGAFVTSSAKNMGAFKGVGFAEDLGEFFRLDEYEGYIWTGHARFPTNTPGWWGGAHPFTLLDWSIVHNGEISSYGINKRYLEMFGYTCTLLTDTEVVAYLLDLLVRRHGLSIRTACTALAPPFWKDIDAMPEAEREAIRALRMVYASAALNGPFALLFAYKNGLVGFNDRIKLRPLVAAKRGDTYYMASEECAIRAIAPDVDAVWAPKAGDPVIVELDKGLVIDDEFEPAVERVQSHG